MSWAAGHIIPLAEVGGWQTTIFFTFKLHCKRWDCIARIGISLQRRLFLYKFFFYEVVMKHDSHTLDIGGVREVELAFIDAWIWCSSTGW